MVGLPDVLINNAGTELSMNGESTNEIDKQINLLFTAFISAEFLLL